MTAGRWNATVSGGALLALLVSSTVFDASAALFYVWSAEQVSVAEQQHVFAVQAQKETDARTEEEKAELYVSGLGEASSSQQVRRLM